MEPCEDDEVQMGRGHSQNRHVVQSSSPFILINDPI